MDRMTEAQLLSKITELEERIKQYIMEATALNRRLRSAELKMYGLLAGVAGALFVIFLQAVERKGQ